MEKAHPTDQWVSAVDAVIQPLGPSTRSEPRSTCVNCNAPRKTVIIRSCGPQADQPVKKSRRPVNATDCPRTMEVLDTPSCEHDGAQGRHQSSQQHQGQGQGLFFEFQVCLWGKSAGPTGPLKLACKKRPAWNGSRSLAVRRPLPGTLPRRAATNQDRLSAVVLVGPRRTAFTL